MTVEEAFEVVEADHDWRGWHSITDSAYNPIGDLVGMYVRRHPRDIRFAAKLIATCLGRKSAAIGEPTDEQACIDRAATLMGRSIPEYAEWLQAMWLKECRSLMFAMYPDPPDGAEPRVGASVVLPPTESAAERLMAGEVWDEGLTPDDFEPSSRFVFINALGDPLNEPGIDPAVKNEAQVKCVIYQVAYFRRLIDPLRPVSITIGANPRYRVRLREHEYIETGACLWGTDLPVVVLRHPEESGCNSRSDWKAYDTFIMLLQHCRRTYSSDYSDD